MTDLDLGYLPSFITAPDSQALCAEVDPEVWFPEVGGSARTAKSLCNRCNRCELQDDCLDWALSNGERWGVWGGKSERERRRILRALDDAPPQSRLKPIRHGTEAGYKAHFRHGVPVPADDRCGCRAGSKLAGDLRKKRAAA